MLVLTHPRSGSTEICRIVEKCLTPRNTPRALSELFNIDDRTVFGNLTDAVRFFELKNTSPITVSVLKMVTDVPPKVVADFNYYVPENITFNSEDEISKWYASEAAKRVAMLELFDSFDNFYIVKHFVTRDIDKQLTKQLIKSHAIKNKLILSYRRNILESVFSALVKTYYFDRPRAQAGTNPTDDSFHNQIIGDAHNLHDMPPIEPLPIEINEGELRFGALLPILRLFKCYHQLVEESVDFKNIIVYEDMMESGQLTLTYQGETKLYNLDSLRPRLIGIIDKNGNKKDVVEKKMNYGNLSKEDYFVNSHIVSDMITHEVNNIEEELPGFKATLDKLRVIY